MGTLPLLALAALLAAAPSPDDEADRADVAALLPQDTAVVLRTPSLDAFGEFVRAAPGSDDGDRGSRDRMWLYASGWHAWHLVDEARPVYVALRPWRALGGEPLVLLLPLRGGAPDEVIAVLGALEALEASGWTLHPRGGYVAVSREPFTPGGAPASLVDEEISAPLELHGDVAAWLGQARAAVIALTALVGAQADAGTGDTLDVAAANRAQVDELFDLLAGVREATVGLAFRDGHLVVDGRLAVTAESPLAAVEPARCDRLDDVLATLDPDAPMHLVLAIDAPSYARYERRRLLFAEKALAGRGVDEDAAYESSALLQLLAARCGHVSAGQAAVLDDRIAYVQVTDAEDPEALVDLVARYFATNYEMLGQGVERTRETVDGWTRELLRIDVSEMAELFDRTMGSSEFLADAGDLFYGPDRTVALAFQASEGRVTTTYGVTGDASPVPTRGGGPPPDLAAVLRRLDGLDMRFAARADYGRLLSVMDWSALRPEGLADGATAPPDRSVPVLAWAGGGGRDWVFGLDLDVEGLDAFFSAITGGR